MGIKKNAVLLGLGTDIELFKQLAKEKIAGGGIPIGDIVVGGEVATSTGYDVTNVIDAGGGKYHILPRWVDNGGITYHEATIDPTTGAFIVDNTRETILTDEFSLLRQKNVHFFQHPTMKEYAFVFDCAGGEYGQVVKFNADFKSFEFHLGVYIPPKLIEYVTFIEEGFLVTVRDGVKGEAYIYNVTDRTYLPAGIHFDRGVNMTSAQCVFGEVSTLAINGTDGRVDCYTFAVRKDGVYYAIVSARNNKNGRCLYVREYAGKDASYTSSRKEIISTDSGTTNAGYAALAYTATASVAFDGCIYAITAEEKLEILDFVEKVFKTYTSYSNASMRRMTYEPSLQSIVKSGDTSLSRIKLTE